ncbi:MAG: excinuclease ABC subunit UvrB [Clostridia bacterium]|jgi:excinuclease ABC subunit B|nr:excinuclease ABC subunit UvrB [Clostridia bacterium]
MEFDLVSKYAPAGDQPEAIEKLVEGFNEGLKEQVLLGVTGSGKTFTMANLIQKMKKPTLVIAHNKTLAAQLCNEFREFFPHNRVEYFVSYYDYYQPEAYIVSSDTYIEKDMAINDEIDKLRASATSSILERDDVIIVASVSCIYGLGNPEEYYNLHISLREGDMVDRDEVISRLIDIQYTRNDIDFKRSTFRVKGDTLDIFPASQSELAIKVQFFGDEVEKIYNFEPVSGNLINELKYVAIFPATHYAVGRDRMERALKQIEEDREIAIKDFENEGKLIEAERIGQRVAYDIEMMREVGFCSGIENYSRYFDGRVPGEAPYTLIDYFPKGFLTIIDESHMTLPQIRAMYNGDKARKQSLVEYGFRLDAARDNRPLTFDEFCQKLGQVMYVSATPAKYELANAGQVVEQVIRPTGLLDPLIEVRPIKNQIEELMVEITKTIKRGYRVLVTTLTKKMAESLTTYLQEHNFKTKYMHSEIDTMERVEIVNGLRAGEFDVLVGINLLREGLDMPEVELVCILDADKEGFLRSEGALIQTIGRAARNANGHVIMFADVITDSMKRAIETTEKRRKLQEDFNKAHGIIPQTIKKEIKNTLEITKKVSTERLKKEEIPEQIEKLTAMMKVASGALDFERAIELRNEIQKLRKRLNGR